MEENAVFQKIELKEMQKVCYIDIYVSTNTNLNVCYIIIYIYLYVLGANMFVVFARSQHCENIAELEAGGQNKKITGSATIFVKVDDGAGATIIYTTPYSVDEGYNVKDIYQFTFHHAQKTGNFAGVKDGNGNFIILESISHYLWKLEDSTSFGTIKDYTIPLKVPLKAWKPKHVMKKGKKRTIPGLHCEFRLHLQSASYHQEEMRKFKIAFEKAGMDKQTELFKLAKKRAKVKAVDSDLLTQDHGGITSQSEMEQDTDSSFHVDTEASDEEEDVALSIGTEQQKEEAQQYLNERVGSYSILSGTAQRRKARQRAGAAAKKERTGRNVYVPSKISPKLQLKPSKVPIKAHREKIVRSISNPENDDYILHKQLQHEHGLNVPYVLYIPLIMI